MYLDEAIKGVPHGKHDEKLVQPALDEFRQSSLESSDRWGAGSWGPA